MFFRDSSLCVPFETLVHRKHDRQGKVFWQLSLKETCSTSGLVVQNQDLIISLNGEWRIFHSCLVLLTTKETTKSWTPKTKHCFIVQFKNEKALTLYKNHLTTLRLGICSSICCLRPPTFELTSITLVENISTLKATPHP